MAQPSRGVARNIMGSWLDMMINVYNIMYDNLNMMF